MITVSMHVTDASAEFLDDTIELITNCIVETGPFLRDLAVGMVHDLLMSSFEDQGAGGAPWPELSMITIKERLRLGFPGPRPILIRTGAFEAAVAGPAGAPGHVVFYRDLSKGNFTAIIGTTDERFEWHQYGTPFMSARPMWPEDEIYQAAFVREMESVLVPKVEEAASG